MGILLDPQTGRPFPGFDDGLPLPHALTFQAITSSSWRAWYKDRYDEALLHGRADAQAMRNDCGLMALLQERILGTTSLRHHVWVEDERDPAQALVQDTLTKA